MTENDRGLIIEVAMGILGFVNNLLQNLNNWDLTINVKERNALLDAVKMYT